MRAEHRLARTQDGRLVPETDPAGRTLAYIEGQELSAADAARMAPAAKPEVKESAPERTKEVQPERTKSRKKATNQKAG